MYKFKLLTSFVPISPHRSLIAISVSHDLVTSTRVPRSIEVHRGVPVSLICLIIRPESLLSAGAATGIIILQGIDGNAKYESRF